jgi:hypothetical protein
VAVRVQRVADAVHVVEPHDPDGAAVIRDVLSASVVELRVRGRVVRQDVPGQLHRELVGAEPGAAEDEHLVDLAGAKALADRASADEHPHILILERRLVVQAAVVARLVGQAPLVRGLVVHQAAHLPRPLRHLQSLDLVVDEAVAGRSQRLRDLRDHGVGVLPPLSLMQLRRRLGARADNYRVVDKRERFSGDGSRRLRARADRPSHGQRGHGQDR